MLRRSFLALALGLLSVVPLTASAADKPLRMLFVTQSAGFKHSSVTRPEGKLSPAEIALTELGQKSGLFQVDCTQDCANDFKVENLKKYDIVGFYTTLNLPIDDEAKTYFFGEWVRQKGHGVLGFHSAGDTFHDYEPYWDLMGGTFIGHPWNAGNTVTFTGHDPENPISKPFGKEFTIKDEIYMYRHWQPEKCRVLLSLDYAKSATGSEINTDHGYHVPLAWVKKVGDGKLYYNNLGHNETSWTNPAYLESITNAVKWFRGEIEVDTTPNPEVSKAYEEKSKKDFEAGEFKGKKK